MESCWRPYRIISYENNAKNIKRIMKEFLAFLEEKKNGKK